MPATFQTYYTSAPMRARPFLFALTLSDRSDGKTFNIKDNLHYRFFDIKRKIERIIHPTGLFIVLLGVDGAGKTTIAEKLKRRYVTAFRRINHYHSRVRALKDISQIKLGSTPIDASDPHGKKRKSGKVISLAKFSYYFLT